jgi:hypothetical protein
VADNKTSIVITAEDRASATLRAVEGNLGTLGGSVARLIPQLGAMGGALSLGGMVMLTKQVIDAGDTLNDLSQRLGIGVKSLASWKLATDQNGVSMEAMATGVKKLSVFMVEHEDRLKKAGITAKDADTALLQLSDIFAAMPDGVQKTALAVELFGKSGTDLIPLLNQGSKGLGEARDKAREYAEQMEKLAPQADLVNDQIAELNLRFDVMKVTLGSTILPGLNGFLQWLNDVAAGGEKARNALEWMAESDSPLVRGVAKFGLWANSRPKMGWNGPGTAWEAGQPASAYNVKPSGVALPGANSPAEIEAMRRARALLGGKPEKTIDTRLAGFDDNRSAAEIMRELHAQDEALDRARKKYIDLIDPVQKYREELDEIDRLLGQGALTADQALEARWKVQEKITDATADTTEKLKEQRDVARELGMTFTSAFEDAVIGGKKFSDVLRGLGDDIARIILRKSITEPLANKASSLLDGFDFKKLFGFASGGSFTVGGSGSTDSQLVAFRATPGEEVSVRTPAQQGAGGGVTIVQNISIDARSDQATIMAAMVRAKEVAKAEIMNSMRRGGAFA